ncbi:MAG: hypothetical protein ACE15E_04690 [Acidobacteriota bacterium]
MQFSKMLFSLIVCLALTLLVGMAIRGAGNKAEKASDPALASFIENTRVYVELRQKIEKDLPSLKDKEDAESIRAHQQTLRVKLAAARSGAGQGSLFTPKAAKALKQIIRAEMLGPGGNTARTTVLESSPKDIPCTVNGAYPSMEPVSTVPPELLLRLPELPDNLEYRFVQGTLILRDAKANMILDCLPNALPSPARSKAKGSSTQDKTE